MSGVFERFQKLTVDQRMRVVARIKAGLTDEPEDYEAMLGLVEDDNRDLAKLPGGMTRLERDSHEARVRAAQGSRPGYLDLPGDDVRRAEARRARRAAGLRQQTLGGYTPPYPWQEI